MANPFIKMEYAKYACCPCGYAARAKWLHKYAFDYEWRAPKLKFCPKCGRSTQLFQIKTRKWVSEAKWYNPRTWANGYWQYTDEQGNYWREDQDDD